MGCNCGRPPIGGFPPVVKVASCEKIVFFKSVLIPASLGDDSPESDYAPTEGAYRNMVVSYQANGNVYLYDSEGFYTRIGSFASGTLYVDALPESSAALVDVLYVIPDGTSYLTHDGKTWIEVGSKLELADELGDDATKAISQRATTEAIQNIDLYIAEITSEDVNTIWEEVNA